MSHFYHSFNLSNFRNLQANFRTVSCKTSLFRYLSFQFLTLVPPVSSVLWNRLPNWEVIWVHLLSACAKFFLKISGQFLICNGNLELSCIHETKNYLWRCQSKWILQPSQSRNWRTALAPFIKCSPEFQRAKAYPRRESHQG